MPPEMPHQSASDPVDEAYRHWKAVHARLVHTIQDYAEACDSLSATLSQHSGRNSSNKTLIAVDDELPGFAQDLVNLTATHKTLSRSRNHSEQLVPINKLPLEILSQIFLLATRTYTQPDNGHRGKPYISPSSLAGVCSIWRKTAISLPSLWSHIDIYLNGPKMNDCLLCAKSWVERAKNNLLFLDLMSWGGSPTASEVAALELLNFLAPLGKQVQSICMFTQDSTDALGRHIMAHWIKHGSANSVRLLKLNGGGTYTSELQPWDPLTTGSLDAPSQEQADAFFRSVQYLQLGRCFIPRTSAIYYDLVHFELQGFNYRPTQSQLAAILQSGPRLRCLIFRYVEVQP